MPLHNFLSFVRLDFFLREARFPNYLYTFIKYIARCVLLASMRPGSVLFSKSPLLLMCPDHFNYQFLIAKLSLIVKRFSFYSFNNLPDVISSRLC